MMKIRLGLLLLCATIGVSVAQAQTQEETISPSAVTPSNKTIAQSITRAAAAAKLTAGPDADDSERNTATEVNDAAIEARAAADSAVAALADGELRAVPLYEEYELIEWINSNRHLQQVRDTDNCQLTQDIEARAEVLRLPAYQFLWGDMLAWGVCVPQK